MATFLWLLMVYAATSNPASAAKSKYLSSKKDMEALVKSEQKLYRVLTNYTEHLQQRMELLKKYHEEFNKAFDDSANGVEEYLDNPVNAFLFARRLLVTWKEVEDVMSGDVGKDWAKDLQLQRYLRGVKLPSRDDMTFAARQVKKLQDQYQLNATEMANGEPYGIPLNSGDCFELGKETYEDEDFEHAYDWLQEALVRVGDGRSKEEDIVEYLAAVAYYKGRIRQALKFSRRLQELSPKKMKVKGNIEYYETLLKKISSEKRKALRNNTIAGLLSWPEEEIDELTEQICNRSISPSEVVLSKLRCRHVTRSNPILLLQPLHEEDVYLKPRIVLYHDVLTDADIEELKAAARLYPFEKYGITFASQGVVPDGIRSAINVNKRSALISGLAVTYSDLLVVTRYDRGGAHRWHLDHQEAGVPDVRKSGNKLATIQYFLDDSKGGDTVFPALKLAVQPQKGSVLCWYNSQRNGLGDDLSLHGTCHVKSNQHWEAVKWVRSFGNEFTRPCGLKQM